MGAVVECIAATDIDNYRGSRHIQQNQFNGDPPIDERYLIRYSSYRWRLKSDE